MTGPGFSRSTVSAADGAYAFTGLPNAPLQLSAVLPGFSTFGANLKPSTGTRMLNVTLRVGGLSETVEVNADAPLVDVTRAAASSILKSAKGELAPAQSANVANLQRRVAGVLPVRIDIPRAGHSYRFKRPLVVDEETFLTFKYKDKSK